MPSEIKVEVRTEWVEAEPDGEKCMSCGDAVFLRAWRVELYLNGNRRKWNLDAERFCDSCKNIF